MRSYVLVICSILGCAVASAFGGLMPESQMAKSSIDALFVSGWSIGPEISWLHYEEPGRMEEDGVLCGVFFSSTNFMHISRSKDKLFRFEGSIAAGKVDYDGVLRSGRPYTINSNKDVLANVRLLWGNVWFGADYSNCVYGGVGYRYLGDDLSHDPAGYKRQSNYFYLPIGYERGQGLNHCWYLGLGAEFDFLLYGLQRSDIFGPGYEAVETPQHFGSGYGLRGSVELRHKGETLNISFEPFIQYWWVDDSEASQGIYEPQNNSTQFGLDVIFHF